MDSLANGREPTPRRRQAVLAVFALCCIAIIIASALSPSWGSNTFIAAFYLELSIPILGGTAALVYAAAHPARAFRLLGIGLYGFLVGMAFTVLPHWWFPSDNAGLGMMLLGMLMVLMAVIAILVGAIHLPRHGDGASIAPLFGTAVLAALLTVGLVLLRGPGDWATASTSVKLYSFPVMIIVVIVSAGILAGGRESV